MPRCPECWSAVDAKDRECAQCGHALGKSSKRGGLALAGIALIAVGITAWLMSSERENEQHERIATVTDPSAEPIESVEPTETSEPIPTTPHHWHLERAADERRVAALAIRTDDAARTLLFLPLASLPRTGVLRADGATLDLDVVNVDAAFGYALLAGARVPASVVPVALGDGRALPRGTSVQPIDSRGNPRPDVDVLGHNADGTLSLSHTLPPDCVLFADGLAVAATLGGDRALELDPVRLWLEQRVGRPLTDVQAELRSDDPRWLLVDIDAMLGQDPLTESAVREAVALCERAAAFARDRDLIEAAQQRHQVALHNLVRLESQRDFAAAILTARSALTTFPGHAGITADLVRLLAGSGDPIAAAQQYEQLLASSPTHAEATAKTLAEAFIRSGGELRTGGRTGEAIQLLQRGLRLFHGDATMHLAYARALFAAGDTPGAVAAARHAASLDPSLVGAVDSFLAAAENSDAIVIPFDPNTHAIDAAVSVGGHNVNFVVDTGATMTTIPTSIARALNLLSDSNPKVVVNTASGQVTGQTVRVPWIDLGSHRLSRVRAVVIDLPGALTGRGLLGMNVLRRFDVQIDSQNGRMTLKKRRNQ